MTKEQVKNRVQSMAISYLGEDAEDMEIRAFNAGVDAAMHGHGLYAPYKPVYKAAFAKGHAAYHGAVKSK